MSNPYDQFDETPANPYAQFDTPSTDANPYAKFDTPAASPVTSGMTAAGDVVKAIASNPVVGALGGAALRTPQGVELGKEFAGGARNLVGGGVSELGAIYTQEDAAIDRRVEELLRENPSMPVSQAVATAKDELPAPAPLNERSVYTAGKAISAAGTGPGGALEPDRSVPLPQIARDLASGAGSMAAGIGVSMIPGVGPSVAGGLFTASGGAEARDNAQRFGFVTPEQERQAAALGNIAGATDLVDMLFASGGTPGRVAGLVRRFGLRPLIGALAEGGQEGLQQWMQNQIEKGVYNPSKDDMEGVGYNALLGAILGGGGGVVQGISERGAEAPPPVPTPAEITAAYEAVRGGPPVFDPNTQPGENLRRWMNEALQPEPTAPQDEVAASVTATQPAVDPLPTYYSNLTRAASEKLPNSGSPDQMLMTLRNTPGVKQEEIEATGLDSFLAQQRGQVSKAEILEHLEENQVQVEEVLHDTMMQGFDRSSSFADYRAPGPQQGYRELLLTLPNKNPLAQAEARYAELARRSASGGLSPQEIDEWGRLGAEVGDRRSAGESPDRGTFKGSHWGEPNVVAHVRFTDRTDRSGRRVLHVEEIQSDWHQTGRKQGYRSEATVPRYTLEGNGPWVIRAEDGRFIEDFNNLRVAQARLQDYQRGAMQDAALQYRVPDAPFKTSWPELTFKRVLRWAADNGYSRITWNNGDLAARYAAGGVRDPKTKAGLSEFYDKIIPSIARRWAKKLGGMMGYTDIAIEELPTYIPQQVVEGLGWGVSVNGDSHVYALMNHETGESYYARSKDEVDAWIEEQSLQDAVDSTRSVPYLDIPERAKSFIQQGLPLFTVTRGDDTRVFADPNTVRNLAKNDPMTLAIERSVVILAKVAKEFKLDTKIRLVLKATPPQALTDTTQARAYAVRHANGTYSIVIHTAGPVYSNISDFYVDMMHEFGHIVSWEHFARAPEAQQRAIKADFERFRAETAKSRTVGDVVLRRDNAVMILRGRRPMLLALNELTQEQREYWSHFEEWMAEQVARWATSSMKPLTIAERFFQGLGAKLLKILITVSRATGLSFRAAPSMQAWLDSFITTAPPLAAKVYDQLDLQSQQENQRRLDEVEPGLAAVPRQPETDSLRATVTHLAANVPVGPQRQALNQLPAFADKFNSFYKWMIHAFQLGELNPQLQPLQRYLEKIRAAGVEEAKINDAAIRVLKEWDNLGRDHGERLALLLDDITNMNYRTPAEVARGVGRHPTTAEFNAMVTKHRVSSEGLAVFQKITKLFDGFLDLSSQLAMAEAMKITDPVARMNAVNVVRQNIANLRSRPYFPFMRFGRHVVVVKNAAGVVVHREHFERRGLSSAESQQKKAMVRLQAAFPGYTVTPDILSESSGPLIGMPAMMLDMISQKLALTPQQQKALEQLRFEMAPAQSFRHRFQHKSYVAGYSQDFKRAFAQYFFHGAKWYVKVKYADGLRQDIKDTHNDLATSTTPTKRLAIANFMADHLEKNFLNPATDFILFKAGLVLYTLAFVPASAVINMSQTPMVTLPFLASKFGIPGLSDLRAGKALAKSIANWENYYKKGHYQTWSTADERALDYAIKTGRLDQTLAGELAAWSQGSNLGTGYGGTLPSRILHETLRKGMWMFEMAEKWNRRVAFMATLDLARNHPNVPYVRETVAKYRDELAAMVASGFTQAEAEAILVANHTVDQTQFMGTTESRPKFMRGKWGSFFLYKRFLQGLLFLGANNKSGFVPRFAILMLAVGGLQGLPGYDDLEEIIRVLAYRLFGKDFKLSREIRQLIVQLTDSTEAADQVLNGTSRMGFGIPALLNLMGNQVGMPRVFPTVDMSRSISPGAILPVELGKLVGPPISDPSKMFGEQSARASGVIGGLAMNFYKALASTDSPGDFKRWESAMPRAMRNLSHAYRAFTEGRERGRSDVTIVPFNVNDPEHLGEIVGLMGGFQPERLTKKWEELREQGEIIKFLSTQRGMLLTQWAKAIRDNDNKAVEKMQTATIEYNQNLPEWARGYTVTRDTLERSVRTRLRTQQLFEMGLSPQRSNMPVLQHIQKLYGTQPVDVRQVR